MEYFFDNMQIHIENTRNNREKQIYRIRIYLMLLQSKISKSSTKEIVMFSDQKSHIAVFCTILEGILISLIAGIILEAIAMTI